MSDRLPEITRGSNGRIEIDGEWLTIKRRGPLGRLRWGLKAGVTLSIADISSVELSAPGRFTRGWIRFRFGGGREGKLRRLFGGASENSLMFDDEQTKEFEALKDKVEAHVDNRS